jgi:hypothetical protein
LSLLLLPLRCFWFSVFWKNGGIGN